CFDAHSIGDQFAPSDILGPIYKVWWTGMNKGAAGTIETDSDWAPAIAAILKKKATCAVNVEYDLDTLQPYQIRKRPISFPDADEYAGEELTHGTKVPRIDAFSDTAQLHGGIILELKGCYVCKEGHLGEHGEPAYCYPSPRGHVALNLKRFREWAAAIAGDDATRKTPPNTALFQSTRDGGVKPRGCSGPHSGSKPGSSSTTSSTDASVANTMLLAMIPLMTTLAGAQFASSTFNPRNPPVTPSRDRIQNVMPSSPIPEPPSELHDCLVAFREKRHIDVVASKCTVSRLMELTDASEGNAMKLQDFAVAWSQRLAEKKRWHGDE
ncbi:hypothetical protein JAAARDRAFT_51925, partial [Jaapia argillacea MUCL 33604]